VILSSLIGVAVVFQLRPIVMHLKIQRKERAVEHLWHTLKEPRYLFAFSTTGLMTIGAYMLMPFGSDFTVNNMGISITLMPFVFFVTGSSALVLGPLIGRLADRWGKSQMFLFGALITVPVALIYTRLGLTPLWLAIVINVVFFIGIFSRVIPAQALISSLPEVRVRGSFMAINSSLQQLAGGLASLLAGSIVTREPDGRLGHFEVVGYVLVATVVVTVFMVFRIERWVMAARPGAALSSKDAS
jgi:predicted MFS family arabinose efflux permease